MLLLAAAIAPAVFMLHFIYVRDKYEREPLGRVLQVYFLSFLTVVPAVLWELNSPKWEEYGLLGVAVSCWGVIALAEETCKYLALRWLAVRHPSFNEVYDGILYAVAASLGFATLENIMYVMLGGGLGVALLRALLSVPGHALWGVIMGYYVGRARFAPPPQQRGLVLTGWGLAVFWHGLYDFFAFGADAPGNPFSLLFALGVPAVVIVNWVIAVRLIRAAQAESVFKRPPPLVNPVGALAMGLRYCHQCGKPGPRSNVFCSTCGYRYPE
jgi:RsiW-degrading membrane proteinase PrsW (M82 family)